MANPVPRLAVRLPTRQNAAVSVAVKSWPVKLLPLIVAVRVRWRFTTIRSWQENFLWTYISDDKLSWLAIIPEWTLENLFLISSSYISTARTRGR